MGRKRGNPTPCPEVPGGAQKTRGRRGSPTPTSGAHGRATPCAELPAASRAAGSSPPRSLLSPVCRCPCPYPPPLAACIPRLAQLRLPPAHLQPRRPRRSVRGAAEPCGAGGSSAGPGGEGKGMGRKGKGWGGGPRPVTPPPSSPGCRPPAPPGGFVLGGGEGWEGGLGNPPRSSPGRAGDGCEVSLPAVGGTHTPIFWQNHLMIGFVVSPMKVKGSSTMAARGWERGGQGNPCPPHPKSPYLLEAPRSRRAGGERRGPELSVPPHGVPATRLGPRRCPSRHPAPSSSWGWGC